MLCDSPLCRGGGIVVIKFTKSRKVPRHRFYIWLAGSVPPPAGDDDTAPDAGSNKTKTKKTKVRHRPPYYVPYYVP